MLIFIFHGIAILLGEIFVVSRYPPFCLQSPFRSVCNAGAVCGIVTEGEVSHVAQAIRGSRNGSEKGALTIPSAPNIP